MVSLLKQECFILLERSFWMRDFFRMRSKFKIIF
jgi:hypothetical protein